MEFETVVYFLFKKEKKSNSKRKGVKHFFSLPLIGLGRSLGSPQSGGAQPSVSSVQQQEAPFCYRPASLAVKKSNWPVLKVTDGEFVHLLLKVHEETFYLVDAGGNYGSSRVSVLRDKPRPLLVVCRTFLPAETVRVQIKSPRVAGTNS